MWSRRRFGLVAMKGVGLSWVVEFFWGNFNFLLRREGLYLYMCVCMGNMEKVRHLGLWRVGNLNKRSEVHAKEVERLLHFWMSTHGWRKIMVYIKCIWRRLRLILDLQHQFLTWVHGNFLYFGPRKWFSGKKKTQRGVSLWKIGNLARGRSGSRI